MVAQRAKDLFAAFAVGNGVLDLIAPRQRALLRLFGPEGLRKRTLWFADHPTAMRLRGMVRIGVGIWLALRQYEKAPPRPWYQRRFSEWFSRSFGDLDQSPPEICRILFAF